MSRRLKRLLEIGKESRSFERIGAIKPLYPKVIRQIEVRKDSIKMMKESHAKAVYKLIFKKTLTIKQGSYFCWLYYFGMLKYSFITSNTKLSELLIKQGYDLTTAFND